MIDTEGFLAEYEALCKKYKIIVGTYGAFREAGLGIVEKDSRIDEHIAYLNARIVARHHVDYEKERCEQANIVFESGRTEQANLNELLEIDNRGKIKKTGLFDF